MDAKFKAFFNSVSQLSLFNMELHPAMLVDTMATALNYDYDTAVNLWEFYFEKYETVFVNIPKSNRCMSIDVLNLFFAKSEQKTLKTLSENAVLKKYLLTMSDAAFNPVLLNAVCQSIVAGKIDYADLFVKFLSKNPRFGQIFLEIIAICREKLLAKQQGNIKLSSKQATFLSSYAAKIKSEEKSVALQRVKEIS